MAVSRTQHLSPSLPAPSLNPKPTAVTTQFSVLPIRASLLTSLSAIRFSRPFPPRLPLPVSFFQDRCLSLRVRSSSSSVTESTLDERKLKISMDGEEEGISGFSNKGFVFDDDGGFVAGSDMKHLDAPELEVKELEELPEQWRRSKLAWLCKELPAHKAGTLVRILNAQRKWMTQEDATYIAVHCLRIRENEAGFKVYKWMMRRPWYRFDFALATKLADYMGKEGKYAKCREIFDDIFNQGRVPSESTFHILIVAYLSTPFDKCLDEACSIYNRMIQLGGYRPRLALHNSLFRALLSKPGGCSKHYVKQAEFIFHNLETSGLEIHKDIYGGLIWLHSYQDTVDKERIRSLRKQMQQAGFREDIEVLVSVLRACSKDGDIKEAERCWLKLLAFDSGIPSQAFVCKMEVHAKLGEFIKSVEVFREMEKHLGYASVAGYHKIIEVLCKAQQVEQAEAFMKEFIETAKKNALMPAFIDLTNMYLNLSLHEKLESTFLECLGKCQPNRTIYNIYLKSLVEVGNIGKAEEVFSQMHDNKTIGINSQSCNTILSGYLSSGDYVRAEKIYDLVLQKRYEVQSEMMEKLTAVLSSSKKELTRPVSLKLSVEQRQILVGLLLGGLQIIFDDERKSHSIWFKFNENSVTHSILKRYIYDQFHEWLHPSSKLTNDDIPYNFSTILHPSFRFYADQFWPKGQPMIPKLIQRWLSPHVLAYWYMYGGHRTSSGDILLKLKGDKEGVQKIVKALKEKSVDCRVKRKGRVFWIGFLGSNATSFWKIVEPYVLDKLKDFLQAGSETMEGNMVKYQDISFDGASDSDDNSPYYSEDEDL